MKKHHLMILAVALTIAVFTANASAANPAVGHKGHVPAGTLAKLGLGGMKLATDTEGEQVRGMALVFGSSSTGFFVTDVTMQALSHSKLGFSMPGQVIHDLTNRTTTLNYHPQFGIKTLK